MAQFSNSERPDLDWSQVRETVKLLTVSVAQVENSLKIGDNSVNTLTESFTGMVGHLQAIKQVVAQMQEGNDKILAFSHCESINETVNASIIAFQFYDRLQQCLAHVSTSLKGLSELVEDPQRLYNPNEWTLFQKEMRARYTMETEKIMFDAILAGKGVQEALNLASVDGFEKPIDEDDVELF